MTLKSITLTLIIAIMSHAGMHAQLIDMLTQQQARDVIDHLCTTINNSDLSGTMEAATGISDIQMKASVADGNTFALRYVMSEYSLVGNSPAEQAFTKVVLSGGGRNMDKQALNMTTALISKAGYGVRVTYTDGLTHSCTINLTPDELQNLWTGDLAAAGVDRDLAREGMMKSFASGIVSAKEEFKDLFSIEETSFDCNWIKISIKYNDDIVAAAVTPAELKKTILEEFATTPVIAHFAKFVSYSSGFLGVDGIKISYSGTTVPERSIFISWSEMS